MTHSPVSYRIIPRFPLLLRRSNRHLAPPSLPEKPRYPLHRHPYVRPHHGDRARVAGDRDQEIPEQHAYPVALHQEPDEGPPEEDQYDARYEGSRAFYLFPPREEEQRLLRPDDQGQTEEEEDLGFGLGAMDREEAGRGEERWGTDVAHC